jgi:predicted transcriptional regulator of viral defense system
MMKRKRIIERLKPLLQKPSFTIAEAEELGVSRRMLGHYVKTGDLLRLSAGVFCSSNERLAVDFQWEDLVRTLSQIPDGIVCLTTALRLWDLTDEHSSEFWIAIPVTQWPPRIRHVRSVRMRNLNLGRTILKLGEWDIPIFDPERTVIDSFRYLSIETAVKSLKRLSAQRGIDFRKLSEYAKALRVNITPYLIAVSA